MKQKCSNIKMISETERKEFGKVYSKTSFPGINKVLLEGEYKV